MASSSKHASLESQLDEVETELVIVDSEIEFYRNKKQELIQRRDKLKSKILQDKSAVLSNQDWDGTDFPWSSKLGQKMKESFKISSFRPYQLSTMNATMSGHDVILIMPTGGGKSLCYQLPALVAKGITLVVSPLVSLMEDQVMALHSLGIKAQMLSAASTKEDSKSIMTAMIDKNADLKLLYVTPERLAKSKTFMSKLQKMFQMGRFTRLAIDEVHCCSQWGHDFRKDYKFLGIFRGMFPGVPILGLTATATAQVVEDAQKILSLNECILFKASFNRPNLYYEVRSKPSSSEACLDMLENLMKTTFKNQSGIIYTTTTKETEELASNLNKRGLSVGCYHANLDPKYRSHVHKQWIENSVQAVIATMAFGMGIDKSDVRFVIHYSIARSVETFYQESGRAGRDDKPAHCITFFRFADVFRISTMVFTEQTGKEKLYNMVAFCLDTQRCRRSIIADHFGERFENSDCNKMCDHCKHPKESNEVNITKHCKDILTILQNAAAKQIRVTGQMLVEAWIQKGQAKIRVDTLTPPSFSREVCERIVAFFILEGYLKEDFHFTAYSTISYIIPGSRSAVVKSGQHQVTFQMSGKTSPSNNNSVQSKSGTKPKGKLVMKKQVVVTIDDDTSSDDEEFQPPPKKKSAL